MCEVLGLCWLGAEREDLVAWRVRAQHLETSITIFEFHKWRAEPWDLVKWWTWVYGVPRIPWTLTWAFVTLSLGSTGHNQGLRASFHSPWLWVNQIWSVTSQLRDILIGMETKTPQTFSVREWPEWQSKSEKLGLTKWGHKESWERMGCLSWKWRYWVSVALKRRAGFWLPTSTESPAFPLLTNLKWDQGAEVTVSIEISSSRCSTTQVDPTIAVTVCLRMGWSVQGRTRKEGAVQDQGTPKSVWCFLMSL